MSDHVSQEEWILFFGGEMTLPEKIPILRHCAECTECRSLLNAANDLRFAAERSDSVAEIETFPEEQAFRAVAGKAGPKAASAARGYLSFRLERTENGYLFSDDDPEAGGFGNRYAMNRSPDGRQFRDDADALCAQIIGNRLRLSFDDPGVTAIAQLILDGSEPDAVPLQNDVFLDLPADGFCELEIVFKEG